MTVDLLPPQVIEGAELRGSEYGWKVAAFPDAIDAAKRHSYACLGGQFQFRTPDGSVREMYWLEADSTPRKDDEPWQEYATRSCDEVRERFLRVVQSTDWNHEVSQWAGLSDGLPDPGPLEDALVFVAYFITEVDERRLRNSVDGG